MSDRSSAFKFFFAVVELGKAFEVRELNALHTYALNYEQSAMTESCYYEYVEFLSAVSYNYAIFRL